MTHTPWSPTSDLFPLSRSHILIVYSAMTVRVDYSPVGELKPLMVPSLNPTEGIAQQGTLYTLSITMCFLLLHSEVIDAAVPEPQKRSTRKERRD